ncbi:MAG: anti-sigma factor family protein [Actinomycetes bacterium]
MMLVTALAYGAERRRATQGVPMSCWQARRDVSDYMDGGLDAEQRHRLEAHLAGCPTCPSLYAGLVGVRAAMSALRDPDSVVPGELVRRLTRAGEHAGEHGGPAR